MKTEKTEMTVLNFNEDKFNAVKSSLLQLIGSINEKPVPSEDPYSVRTLLRNGIKNDSFVSLCLEFGIVADKKVFQSAYNKGETVIMELLLKGVPDSMIDLVRTSKKPMIGRLSSVLSRLKSSVSLSNHLIAQQYKAIIDILRYVSFENGLAVITDETLQTIREEFTIYLSDDRKEIIELLENVAGSINRLNKILIEKNVDHVRYDTVWFSEDENANVMPNLEMLIYC